MSPLDVWAGPIFAVLLLLASIPFAIAHRRREVRRKAEAREQRRKWENRRAQGLY